jgi:caspase domain-containing protein/PDZ domain-containing protein
MRYLTLLALVTITCASIGLPAQDRRLARPDGSAGRRLALVVGNNSYPSVPLVNAVNDARAVDAALRSIGFVTELVSNATLEAMDRAVEGFVSRIQPGDVALVYYSGHGVQVAGENYLIPIDFRGTDTTSLRRRTTSVSELQERLQERGARVRILILDACRDNPYSGTRSGTGGLAAYQAEGALIAYATAAGKTASDNAAGANGLFTAHLLKLLATPGVSISELFRGVREAVSTSSNGRQVPWVSDGLIGNFALVPGAVPAPPSSAAPAVPDADLARREELAYWESIKDSETPKEFEAYLQRYGANAVFAGPARLKIQKLSQTPTAASSDNDLLKRFFGGARGDLRRDAMDSEEDCRIRVEPSIARVAFSLPASATWEWHLPSTRDRVIEFDWSAEFQNRGQVFQVGFHSSSKRDGDPPVRGDLAQFLRAGEAYVSKCSPSSLGTLCGPVGPATLREENGSLIVEITNPTLLDQLFSDRPARATFKRRMPGRSELRREIDVTYTSPAEARQSSSSTGAAAQPVGAAAATIGINLVEIGSIDAGTWGLSPSVAHLMISGSVNSNFRDRDVIAAVNGIEVHTKESFETAAAGLLKGTPVSLTVLRDGTQRVIKVEPPANGAAASRLAAISPDSGAPSPRGDAPKPITLLSSVVAL